MGKVAIVTGAASGIGKALATALVARGDTVVLLDVDPEVKVVADVLHHHGPGAATPAVADVRDPRAVQGVVADTEAAHGRVDLMINNAGIGMGGLVEDLSPEHWDRIIDVNIKGVINGVQAVYPLMLEQGFGQIANTASGLGLIPQPLLVPYCMTKHAVVGLTLSMRPEAAERGIKVSVICPGVIDTPILDKGNPPDLPPMPYQIPGREYLSHFNEPMNPETFAAAVLNGLARDEAVIIAPRRTRTAWWLQRLVPSFVEKQAHASLAWARRHYLGDAPVPLR